MVVSRLRKTCTVQYSTSRKLFNCKETLTSTVSRCRTPSIRSISIDCFFIIATNKSYVVGRLHNDVISSTQAYQQNRTGHETYFVHFIVTVTSIIGCRKHKVESNQIIIPCYYMELGHCCFLGLIAIILGFS